VGVCGEWNNGVETGWDLDKKDPAVSWEDWLEQNIPKKIIRQYNLVEQMHEMEAE
jgi:hypothetical protein